MASTKAHGAILVASTMALGLVLSWGVGTSCARPETTTQSPTRASKDVPTAHVSVNVEGVARDAKLGAVVVGEDGSVYYIAGLREWDPDLLGHEVSVTGVVEMRKLAPQPAVGPDGAVSAGMYGDSPVLTGATWKRVP